MEPKDYNTKKGKYTHLKESERYKIEALLQEKKKPKDIAIVLGRGRSTIYKETKRGAVERLQYDLSKKKQCRADPAQRDYEAKVTGKEHELKIGKDRRIEGCIRKKLAEDKFSPDAIIGEIKLKGLAFEGMICTKTLYNYIDAGISPGITNETLWEKRKRKKGKYRGKYAVSASPTERVKVLNNGPKKRMAALNTAVGKEIVLKVPKGTQRAS